MPLVDGLPLHPLVVHLPVVLIPLIAAGLAVYAIASAWRRPLGAVLVTLAMVAAAGAFVAVWSGDDLGDALGRGAELGTHRAFGERTRAYATVLATATLALVLYERSGRRPRARVIGATAAVTVVAVGSTAAVALTGHTGAKLAWEGEVAAAERPASPSAAPSASVVVATTAPRLAASAGEPAVEVVLGEWALVTSAGEASPGEITFRFTNRGAVAHALRVRTEGSGKNRREWRSSAVRPGETGTLTVDLASGSYELDCPIEDAHGEHDALGMESAFTVREGAQSPPGPAQPAADAPVSAGGSAVDIMGFAFAPANLQVPVGSTVRWRNADPAPHTATGSGWDTGRLDRGAEGAVTFTRPGTFSYVCVIHPAMTGTVVVA